MAVFSITCGSMRDASAGGNSAGVISTGAAFSCCVTTRASIGGCGGTFAGGSANTSGDFPQLPQNLAPIFTFDPQEAQIFVGSFGVAGSAVGVSGSEICSLDGAPNLNPHLPQYFASAFKLVWHEGQDF
jgi:hypothetical protein